MGCPQCQHENHPDAKVCTECGCVPPRLWPQATNVHLEPHARRRRPASGRLEIAAALGVVLVGIGVITAIVLNSPGWQRIFASWPDAAAARSAMVPPPIAPQTPSSAVVNPDAARGEPTIRPEGLGLHQAATISPGVAARLAPNPAPSRPVPAAPSRAQDSPRSAERSSAGPQADTSQVMASLLIAQLGQDTAWRTALTNADAHVIDSPEYTYWRRVATAIRDGGHRARQ